MPPRSLAFIYGTQKSGTTWLRNIVGSFAPIEESAEWYFPALAEGFETLLSRYSFHAPAVKLKLLQANVLAAWKSLLASSLPGCYVDKSAYPCVAETGARMDLFPYAGDMIRFYAPGARQVLIVRDPRDVLISARHYFGRSHVAFDDESYVARFASGWAQCNLHWLASGPTLVLRYEDLKADFATQARRLFADIGIDVSPMDFESCCGIHGSIDVLQRQDPAFYRKGIVDDWKAEMSDRQQQIVLDVVGDALEVFGYAPNGAAEITEGRAHPRDVFEALDLALLVATPSWRAAGVQEQGDHAEVLITGSGVNVDLDGPQLPAVAAHQKLLVLLEVAWSRQSLAVDEAHLFGWQVIRQGAEDGPRWQAAVQPRSRLYGRRAMICIELDDRLGEHDTLRLHLFGGGVSAPLKGLIHAVACKPVGRASGLALQCGDLLPAALVA